MSTIIKQQIYQQLESLIAQRMDTAQSAMQAAEESRDNETKSSAGDKYETGRAMMHLEKEKNKVQLIKAKQLKNELAQIKIAKLSDKVIAGSLVITNQGKYFISVGLGKIIIDDIVYYAVSPLAPIGKVLLNQQVGSSINFQGKTILITHLY